MFDTLRNYIVKIGYDEKHAGSGVIIKNNNFNDSFYIFTAKHLFFAKSEEIRDMKVNDIDIAKISIDNPCFCIQDDIKLEPFEINNEYDFLIIKVSNCRIEENLPTSIFMDEMDSKTNLSIMGFPKIREKKEILSEDKKEKTEYDSYPCTYKHLCENIKHFEINSDKVLTVRDRQGNANEEISGLSGSGVYLTTYDKEVSIVGILIESATGQGIVCFDLRSIIDEIHKKIDINIPRIENQEKKYEKIKQILKKYYSNVEEFREAILDYYPSESENFDKIKNSNTIDELFVVLLKDKWCLYCLLEVLEKPHNLEKFSDTDCSKKREQVLKTRKIETVILKFEENKYRNGYTIHGWLKPDSGSYRNMSVLYNVKFDNNEYKVDLSEYLVRELRGKTLPTPIQLQLILPIELFKVEFKTLKIKLDRSEKEFNRVFDITTRFLDNLKIYSIPNLNTNWKNNSQCYRDNLLEMMGKEFLFHIDNIRIKNMLDCFNNNNKISILSNYSLLNKDTLEEMLDYGLSFTLCPQNEEYDIVNTISFNDEAVTRMKQIIFNFIREIRDNSSIHYIHDDYYDYDEKFLNSFQKSVEYQDTDDDNYLEIS